MAGGGGRGVARARERGGGSEVACSGGRRPGGVFGGTGRRKTGIGRLPLLRSCCEIGRAHV